MTFKEWYKQHKGSKNGVQRIGQKMFNSLNEVRPDLASYVRATPSDPFHASSHEDERVRRFLIVIEERW